MSNSVFVDRIEGTLAVLVTEGGARLELPKSLLPAGVGEGRWLALSLAPDPAKDAAMGGRARRTRERLTEDDDGGDLTL